MFASKHLFHYASSHKAAWQGASSMLVPASTSLLSLFTLRTYAQKKDNKAKQQKRDKERRDKQQKEIAMKKEDDKAKKMEAQKQKTGKGTQKPDMPTVTPKPVLPLKNSNAIPKDLRNTASRDFFNTHQNINFDVQSGYLGLAKEISTPASLEAFATELRNTIDGNVSKYLEVGNASADAIQWLDAVENAKDRAILLFTALKDNHVNQEVRTAAETALEKFATFYSRRVLENTAVITLVSKLSQLGNLTDAQQQVVKQLYSRMDKFGIHANEVEKRQVIADTVSEYEQKMESFQQYLQGLAKYPMERPSRLFEIPSPLYNALQKQKIKKKKRMANLDLQQDLVPILSYVSVPRTRQQLLTVLRSQIENEKSVFYTRLNGVLQSSFQVARAFNADSLTAYNLAKLGVSEQEVVELFADVKAKLDTYIRAQVSVMEDMKKQQLNANPAAYAIVKKEGEEGNTEADKFGAADIYYYSRKFYEKQQQFDVAAVNKFFPAYRAIDGVSKLFKTLFNISLQAVALGPNESFDAKYVKKMQLISTNNTVVGHFYLDLFRRRGKVNKNSQTYLIENDVPSVVISMNLDENVMGLESTLSHEQLRELFGKFGQSLAFLFAKNKTPYLLAADNQFGAQLAGYVFELFAYNHDVLKSFGVHVTNASPVPQEYLKDYTASPVVYPLVVLDSIAYSLIDFELFGPQPLKDKPGKIVDAIESRIVLQNLIPSIANWSRFGGSFFADLYIRIAASQLYASWFANGPNANNGTKWRDAILARGNRGSVKQILNDAIATSSIDASAFVKDVTKQ